MTLEFLELMEDLKKQERLRVGERSSGMGTLARQNVPLTSSKVLALDKTKNTLSSCFDSRTFEIKISRFYNQTNKNIGYFWFCPRLIVPLQKDYEN